MISFDYEEVQIDLILSQKKNFNYHIAYTKFSDLGNLVGKLAHQIGLKHGHNGLFLPIRDGDNKIDEILLTTDIKDTLDFLDLDRNVFAAGFKNLDEIFQFVSKSKYYTPESYKLENLNTIAKVRDRKRVTYKKFLEFGENYKGPVFTKVEDKSVFLPMIFEKFPDSYMEYVDVVMGIAANRYIKEQFNGDIVRELTGLTGKDLGVFMQILKKDFFFYSENLVLQTDVQIRKRILEKYKNHKKLVL